MSMRNCYLSTTDNRYNPSTQFDAWLHEDMRLAIENDRRDCCSMLALFARTSNDLSDKANAKQIEIAIDEIVKHDAIGIYIKVVDES